MESQPNLTDLDLKHLSKFRPALSFDDVSLIPADTAVDPEIVDTATEICGFKLELPVLASAMDAVVDVKVAGVLGRLGGLAVLNLEGLYTRYADPSYPLDRITGAGREEAVAVIQELYREPIKEELVQRRIQQIKAEGVICAVSLTPAKAQRYVQLCVEAGADLLVVQSTVTTASYVTASGRALSFEAFTRECPIPVVVGNCVTAGQASKLMESGARALLVGVGPGAACTSRRVVGVGVPQVTAVYDVACARDLFYERTGRYVQVICDGGMRVGGDVAKAIAAGADAVMIGSPFASAEEAPGRGFHWGMATAHAGLPRGTRIEVGVRGSLQEILLGPSRVEDGTMNLVGALRQAMGICGARTIREMQEAVFCQSSSIAYEGKHLQLMQRVGHGR